MSGSLRIQTGRGVDRDISTVMPIERHGMWKAGPHRSPDRPSISGPAIGGTPAVVTTRRVDHHAIAVETDIDLTGIADLAEHDYCGNSKANGGKRQIARRPAPCASSQSRFGLTWMSSRAGGPKRRNHCWVNSAEQSGNDRGKQDRQEKWPIRKIVERDRSVQKNAS